MKGYKYISDLNYDNYYKYIQKSESKEIISYDELANCQGYYDKENIQGIYFCESQQDLFHWIKELLEWDEYIGAIEILEVISIGHVQERVYKDGRIAYISNQTYVRVLDDSEILSDINKICEDYFNTMR